MPASALTATDTLLKRNAELSKDLSAKSFTYPGSACARPDLRRPPRRSGQVLGLELGEAVGAAQPGRPSDAGLHSELAVLARSPRSRAWRPALS